jgi:hypothetical protein
MIPDKNQDFVFDGKSYRFHTDVSVCMRTRFHVVYRVMALCEGVNYEIYWRFVVGVDLGTVDWSIPEQIVRRDAVILNSGENDE